MHYRSFTIETTGQGYSFAYRYTHEDYNGPEDRRIGHAANVQDCKDAIDDWHFDQIPEEKKCSHVRDNQGFCHNCGIPICEETIRSEGLWKDGMVCDMSNE
jgi:hypothetical protein